MDKPRPKDFGWHESQGFDDEPSGWAMEGGEEAYHVALDKWYAQFPAEEAPMSVEEKAQKWDELCDKARNLLADDAGSEENVCPDCGNRGWLYDENGRRAGTCPCHY